MGLGDLIILFLRRFVSPTGQASAGGVHGVSAQWEVEDLARRLDMSPAELSAVPVAYTQFRIPKRSGGERTITAPADALKTLQRRVLRRVLTRLHVHPAANGFQPGRSIVTNALPHVGKPVVVHLDIQDFFPSTREDRVRKYFLGIGWGQRAADLLTRLCTHEGGLPQGAPTSPRLSNLVNYILDARLDALARINGALYTRYADDMTFSFAADSPFELHALIRAVKRITADLGYRLHMRKKLRITRQSDRQLVTGLVVNSRIHLPRQTRRWLRAVRHRQAATGQATLTPAQLAGWQSLESMIAAQANPAPPA